LNIKSADASAMRFRLIFKALRKALENCANMVVAHEVAGSIPVAHPKYFKYGFIPDLFINPFLLQIISTIENLFQQHFQ
jgi:hypothetical protein